MIEYDHRNSQPELEALIQQRLQSGAFQNVEDVLLHALKSSEPEGDVPARGSNAKNLVELFADSPFAGLDMDFERDTDTGREIEL
jgi:hypothetical protein